MKDTATMLPGVQPIAERLRQSGQWATAAWLEELEEPWQAPAVSLLESLDIDRLVRTVRRHQSDEPAAAADVRPLPQEAVVRLPSTAEQEREWGRAREFGEGLLRDGKVAAMLVAGGQGTRLGFDRAKGMFPVGPVSGATLYQLFCEQLRARSARAGRPIHYCVMTSRATHDETVAYFEGNDYFGLSRDHVHFFEQGQFPTFDAETGEMLLAGPHELATNPDGHGGMLAAFARSGLLDRLKRDGVEHVYYHQVDNPMAPMCDPAFLGWHALRGSDVSTKVVAKRDAGEKMGVLVSADGRTQVIEYSDLDPALAARTDDEGRLQIWAGNTAMHVFRLGFLEEVASTAALPMHVAHKAAPYYDVEAGAVVTPDKPNAYKLEQFIFDLMPLAAETLVVQADRAAEFQPVKNREGNDSPASTRAAMAAVHRRWLEAAGATVADGVVVEISPLVAQDAETLKSQLPPGLSFAEPTYLDEQAVRRLGRQAT